MDLLNENEIIFIINKCGISKPSNLNWSIKNYSDKLIGYLGEHLSLTVNYKIYDSDHEIKFFIKCIPRFDEWKANYLKETDFFNKEYGVLSGLFKNFQEYDGLRKWRPKLLLIKKELFIFEDVKELSYSMPSHPYVLSYEEITASVAALARFHAQSYIYEDKKSQELKRPYKIWEDYSQYLREPLEGKPWRETGMKAAMDFLKVFSYYKLRTDFNERIEETFPKLFASAEELMKPSNKYCNVVIHRDIWANNIFLKKVETGEMHALLIDFQTVLYCPSMLDLSSLMYFNTTKSFRNQYTKNIIEYYYNTLSQELKLENVNIDSIINQKTLEESYKESIVFGITQGILIVPIVAMPDEKKKEVFGNPETQFKVNCISRSQECIELAKENEKYRERVLDILDEVIELYVYPSAPENDINLNLDIV